MIVAARFCGVRVVDNELSRVNVLRWAINSIIYPIRVGSGTIDQTVQLDAIVSPGKANERSQRWSKGKWKADDTQGIRCDFRNGISALCDLEILGTIDRPMNAIMNPTTCLAAPGG